MKNGYLFLIGYLNKVLILFKTANEMKKRLRSILFVHLKSDPNYCLQMYLFNLIQLIKLRIGLIKGRDKFN